MMKVLIVDDEPKLREGLKSIVPWTELGYRVVDTAANGNEALEKHGKYDPDLMLIDIRMPGMDGLQLIEAIRNLDSEIHLLILSGYADFDYAKRAISHRVDGYLLKPVDEDELSKYLLQIKEAIVQEQERKALNRAASDMSREQFIQTWFNPESKPDPAALRHMAERSGLLWNHYQVLLVHHNGSDEPGEETDDRLKNQLIEAFEENGRGAVFSMHGQLGILMPTPVLTAGGRKELLQMVEEAASRAGTAITASLGRQVHCLEDVADSYRCAKERIRERFFYAPGEMLFPESERFAGGNTDEERQPYDPEQLMDQLYYAVDVGNVEVQQKLLHTAAYAMVNEDYTEERMKRAFVELLTGVHNKLMQHHTELQSRTKEYSDRIAAIFRQRTAYDLCRHSSQFLEELIWQAGNGGRDQEMKRIMDLIQRNYKENIKLETLASIFNYNSAYLGKMFKNTTGEYFNTYLDKVRIDKAKDFLKQGMKVYQVAEKVGYTNVDYFHSKFKKYVGTSPSNFRKKLDL
ncbi:two-component system, response regulator YesN [Paenibacillus sp. cl141a]|uniref:response regulator transcription factor n=1 Tax=Paenibacillus sp. cl141a TaxID=1761877 RepID=UPI0008CBE314|nr:response regulator transcription factor [Paenibacillus sp. cl141a]SEM46515.1 two-component system, response regulator YesN [Paenibacillus sp. cl141a]